MKVRAGQPIAFVGSTGMLHFETYIKGTRTSHKWLKNAKRPPQQLLNPTKYLLFLQQYGLPQQASVSLFSALGSLVKRFQELIASGKERLAVTLAYQQGITDESKLTDLVFFTRHSELGGRRIRSHEKGLAKEWLDIRNQVVRPVLSPG
jgi:hypothetical protein